MTTRWLVCGAGVAVVCLTLAIACDNPSSAVPTVPSTPVSQSLTITGPGTLAPGESGQFLANIRLSNGETKAASAASGARWSVTNSDFLQVDANGVATAQQRLGESFIRVQVPIGSRGSMTTGQKEVVIVPSGTFRLTGTVTDGNVSDFRVPNALVEVLPGSMSATTDAFGQFRLYGVPADVNIRVTAQGYNTTTQSLHLTSHTSVSVPLTPSGPRLPLSGLYTLDLDAPDSCGGLSSTLRHRSYEASLAQNGSLVEVTLTEPRFRVNSIGRGNKFIGRASSSGVVFTLDYYGWYYYSYYGPTAYPNVAERLADNTILVTEGSVTATGTSSRVTGTLTSGAMTRWDSRFPNSAFSLGGCSNSIQLTLTQK